MTNLRVYAGAEHPHEAQSPEVLDVKSMNPKNTRNADDGRRNQVPRRARPGRRNPARPEAEAPREPVRDELGRSYATGKRKDAVARVWIRPGTGKVTVNGKEINTYFARPVLQMILRQPFQVAGVDGEFDVQATVKGGGLSGQAGAVKHGISKALQLYDPSPARRRSRPRAS